MQRARKDGRKDGRKRQIVALQWFWGCAMCLHVFEVSSDGGTRGTSPVQQSKKEHDIQGASRPSTLVGLRPISRETQTKVPAIVFQREKKGRTSYKQSLKFILFFLITGSP